MLLKTEQKQRASTLETENQKQNIRDWTLDTMQIYDLR